MPLMTDPDTRARSRFFVMSAVRIAGVLMIGIGMAAASGRFEAVPRAMGVVLVLAGAFCFALAPKLLARRWRTPK